jgi:hypothetical protein
MLHGALVELPVHIQNRLSLQIRCKSSVAAGVSKARQNAYPGIKPTAPFASVSARRNMEHRIRGGW